jgi:chorismate-pyruvate lyase
MATCKNSWAEMHGLSERILLANSATAELECWCCERAIGDGRIVALCAQGAHPQALDDESREALYPYIAKDHTKFRRVQLATSGIVVVDALNWYFPAHLSREMCHLLNTTTIPFGRVVTALKPTRRTFWVQRCTKAKFDARNSDTDLSFVAFEHRAIVLGADGTPLAVVHERFRRELIDFGSTSSAGWAVQEPFRLTT